MSKEQKFYNILQDLFVGAKLEGDSGYVNLMNIKTDYFNKNRRIYMISFILFLTPISPMEAPFSFLLRQVIKIFMQKFIQTARMFRFFGKLQSFIMLNLRPIIARLKIFN